MTFEEFIKQPRHCTSVELARLAWDAGYAAGQANPPEGWKPIESAPKDGTWVLVYGDGTDDEDGQRKIAVAQYTNYLNGSTYDEYWWQFAWYDGGYCGKFKNPTHWMPLPPPPGKDKDMEDKEYAYDLFWHALNYRTAMTLEANDRWDELQACHERIIARELAAQKEKFAKVCDEIHLAASTDSPAKMCANTIRALKE